MATNLVNWLKKTRQNIDQDLWWFQDLGHKIPEAAPFFAIKLARTHVVVVKKQPLYSSRLKKSQPLDHPLFLSAFTNLSIWRFPEIGVPRNHPSYSRGCGSPILGYPPNMVSTKHAARIPPPFSAQSPPNHRPTEVLPAFSRPCLPGVPKDQWGHSSATGRDAVRKITGRSRNDEISWDIRYHGDL